MGRDRTAPFHVDAEQLQRLARDAGVELVARQCEQLLAYGTLLRHWNRVHNLTAIDDDRALLTHHLLDSLAIVRPIEEALARFSGTATPPAFLDAGSGAGLPGIVLAIARPAWSGRLVDAVEKKCAFLQQCLLELGLPRLTVHHARLESFALESNQPAPDLIVSRAFAALPQMTGVTQHLLAPAGLWAAMKGKLPETELAALPADIEVLDTITLRVPLLEEQRHLVLLRRREAAPMPASPAARSPRR
jgi:16S rRNA (guanine527-N7)-methyltransferase